MNRWQFSAFQVLYNINLNYILHYGILTQTGVCWALGNYECNDRFWAMENTKQTAVLIEHLWPKRKQGYFGRCSLNPHHNTKYILWFIESKLIEKLQREIRMRENGSVLFHVCVILEWIKEYNKWGIYTLNITIILFITAVTEFPRF